MVSNSEQDPVPEATERLIEIPFVVARHEHGLRLDLFLSRRMKRMSRSLAARLVQHGRVRCVPQGGRANPHLKASSRVFEGDYVVMKRKPLREASPDDIEVPILFEDERVLAVNKPGNLVVHPTASHYHRTLIRILRTRLCEETLDLAHRIDKETSGLVLIARDFAASSDLKKQFAHRLVEKSYLALVLGTPQDDEFESSASLRLADTVSKVVMEVVPSDESGAQLAQTRFRVLSRGRGASLVHAMPKTGRQHQIRVHLMDAGYPIVGDKLYLADEAFFMRALVPDFPEDELLARVFHARQALHAYSARFRHPSTGLPLELRAPLSPDLIELCTRYGVETNVRLEGARIDQWEPNFRSPTD